MGVFFTINGSEVLIENKNKIRTLWGWKVSKNKNIEPQRNFTGSYKKRALISAYLWSRARLARNKKQKSFSLQDYPLAKKFDSKFLFLRKDKTGIKATLLCNYICRNYSYDCFQIKIFLKFLVKSLQCFFTDHLKHKTVNKTTCRIPSANPH